MGISKIGYPIRGENFKITIDFCHFTLKVKYLKSVDIIFISAKIGMISGLQWRFLA
jgi:hypothetical protein